MQIFHRLFAMNYSETRTIMNYNKENIIKKRRAINSKATKTKSKFLVILYKAVLVCILAVCVISAGLGFGLLRGILENAPNADQIDVQPEGYSTTIYNQEGKELLKLSDFDSNREYVTLDKIPTHMQDAFIAIEDERFYSHNGIDLQGIFRAFFVGIKNGRFSEGASTITQQLIKNNVLGGGAETNFSEQLERKVQEQYLALELEKRLSKEQILEYYLNTINLGQSTLGVQAASKRYFNKDVSDLTISEASVIAGITQNPSALDPIVYPENNSKRRTKILNNMVEQGKITKKEYETAMSDDVYGRIKKANENQPADTVYSYFVDALIKQVIEDLQTDKGYNETQAYNALYRGGLSIYITQDSEIQSICDQVFADDSNFPPGSSVTLSYRLSIKKKNGKEVNYSEYDVERYLKKSDKNASLIFSCSKTAKQAAKSFKKSVLKKGDTVLGEHLSTAIQPQASFCIIEQSTGHIKALVGGRGKKTANLTLNRATQTTRQPGSTFKVLASYLPALDTLGMTLANVLDDAPYNYVGTERAVNNYDHKYRGLTTIREGIRDSINIVTAKTMEKVTPAVAYEYLLNLGFTTLVEKESDSKGNVYSDIQQTLCLGGITKGVTNLELTAAYATIANKGVYTEPILYTKILDHDKNLLLDNEPKTNQVMKESTAWLLTNAMQDVVNAGTGTAVRSTTGMPVAGKTGTTSNNYDVWFSGYNPYYTASIWCGYDINKHFYPGSYHKVIWRKIMDQIIVKKKLKITPFPDCSSITAAEICTESGMLAVPGLCDHDPRGSKIKTEYFTKGTVPTEKCTTHVAVTICKESKLPVSLYCPEDCKIEKIYIKRPEDSEGKTADTPYELPEDFETEVCNIHTSPVAPSDPDDLPNLPDATLPGEAQKEPVKEDPEEETPLREN